MDTETRALLDRLIRLVEAMQLEQRAIKAMLSRLIPETPPRPPETAKAVHSWESSVDWPGEERQGYVKLSNEEEHP